MRMLIVVLLFTSSAHAQDVETDARLALMVARVAANEASLSAIQPADVALIWQVVEGHGETSAARLEWLMRHSSCVTTDRERTRREQRTNCVWSRSLREDFAQPEGWPAHLLWKGSGRDGTGSYAATWERTLKLARRFVAGVARTRLPCRERPRTWGGAMDHTGAVARGLRPVVCIGTHNTGYVRALTNPARAVNLVVPPT